MKYDRSGAAVPAYFLRIAVALDEKMSREETRSSTKRMNLSFVLLRFFAAHFATLYERGFIGIVLSSER